ncbi:nose resistant to fluoxetine protein 6-like [Mizuhopecten yessoensis]|uniref:Nose resistant to fluoxetine protein 6 n=1 Tax=Mizuhopecten yessoensis TaxID=6573 RepID=A0A210QY89_MIZYE|nr:nose resistant to fluoxetine protein 6-like [Mizuhopecten yessoensis]OWF53651.1 Nose resistant to fluoxetine protein 6 [Mizuhopecten yessoensis]
MARSFTGTMLITLFLITCFVSTISTEDVSYQTLLVEGMKKIQAIPQNQPSIQLDVKANLDQLWEFQDSIDPYRILTGSPRPRASPGVGAVVGGFNVSDTCYNDTQLIGTAAMAVQLWALKMIDASGKPPSDIVNGNQGWFGSYDECLSVKSDKYEYGQTPPHFNGKYCIVNLPLDILSLPLPNANLGLCLPDSCSPADAVALTNAALSTIQPGKLSKFAECKKETLEFDDKAIGAVIMCGFILAMMIVGTAFDVIVVKGMTPLSRMNRTVSGTTETTTFVSGQSCEKTPLVSNEITPPPVVTRDQPVELGMMSNILVAFSVYTNGAKLLNTSAPPGSLTALNGIRFLSMTWVILGHTYSTGMNYVHNVSTFWPKMIERWTFQAIINALVSVDTFFALSGLLVSYLFMREMEKTKGKMNWGLFYFHRFWRLTPPYMLVLFVEVTLTRYFANGPFWPEGGFEKDFCEDTWWTNLLYINNLVKTDKTCFAWAWYLANDMQFFVLSPLMLVPLFYSKFIGMAVCLAFLTGTFIATGVISTKYDLPVSTFIPSEKYFDYYYIKPWTRMGPYIIGIMAGYLLYRSKLRYNMHRVLNLLGWAVATTMACVVLYGLYEPLRGNETLSTEVSALYNTVHRSIWGACVCWVIFSCANGSGGFVNTLLSWSGFVPLSRLTYCAYLVHPILQFTVYSSLRQLFVMRDLSMITYFLAFLVMAYGVAFVVSLAFESPMMGLEKAIFKRGKKK